MPGTGRGRGQLIAAAGGALLIASLFLPWAGAGGAARSGWELLTTLDILLVIAGLAAVGAAVTGGRFGLFRPDLSLNAATDLLGVVSTTLIAWLILFDFPAASPEIGAFVGLTAAAIVAGGAGDYRVLRGGPCFPATGAEDPRVG